MPDDIHLLFQQMGEVLSGVRGIYSTIDLRQAQAEQLYDLVRTDLTILRHDQRELEAKLDRMSWIAEHDIENVRLRTVDGDRSIRELVVSVDALKRPIADMTALKARAGGLLVAVSMIGSAVLWLAEPLYRWIIETGLQRH